MIRNYRFNSSRRSPARDELAAVGFFDFFLRMVFGRGGTKPITKNPLLCPQCQVALVPGEQGTQTCEKCAGLWLPHESFTDFLASDQPVPATTGIGDGEHTFQRSPSPRSCAGCERLMDNYEFAYQSGIWIDACPERHGVWLDWGELQMVRDYHRQSVAELTSDDRAKMAMAFLDGATEANNNFVTPELPRAAAPSPPPDSWPSDLQ